MTTTQSTTPLLLALIVASFSLIHADLYGNPSPSPPPPASAGPAPPPPFAVAGKEFPSQSTFCLNTSSPCNGRILTCPKQCPQFRPADPKAKACFVDCSNPTCEAVCKTRKPNCEGNGAACYDPRFVGGDGIMFYFHGKAGHHFALVSDAGLQINAHFIGIRPAGRPRDFTWIQALGLLSGPHTLTIAADRAAAWDPSSDHLSLTYGGLPLPLGEGHLSSWASIDGDLLVERTATVNSVAVTLRGVVEIMATAVPVTKEDDRVHRYGIPDGDCFAHLEVQFRFLRMSEGVEGVLGQTYRPDFKNPVKRGVAMPVMSGEERYVTDSLLSTACKSCIFSPVAEVVDLGGGGAASTLDCTSRVGKGYAVACRR